MSDSRRILHVVGIEIRLVRPGEDYRVSSLKRTPLYPVYQEFDAKTVDFGGFEMPVQFSGIMAEHEAVRNRAGLFDVSHMGEFRVVGPDASQLLQRLVTNDVSKLEPGMAMYSPMTYEHGGTVDDLLIYCITAQDYMTVVNASNIEKDFTWMQRAILPGQAVTLTNESEQWALLAIQGPNAQIILQQVLDTDLNEISFYRFRLTQHRGVDIIVSRTGYTGEDGFEIYVPSHHAIEIWNRLVAVGQVHELSPCGLGARDTLRLEAKLPLYGHELTEDITPLEAGLSMFVKLDAKEFIGRAALTQQKAEGIARKVVGLKMIDKGIPRAGYSIISEGHQVGQITSGTMSPTLKIPIALALVPVSMSEIGTPLWVDVRGKQLQAEVVKTPFYRRIK